MTKPAHEEIQVRAYFIWLKRGMRPNNALSDWLDAEMECEYEHHRINVARRLPSSSRSQVAPPIKISKWPQVS
jgi:hypothetical protein